MIYTITFNPSLDYIVTVENFSQGIVNRTTKELIFPGGKGLNVSMVLSNLGYENTALGFIAGFVGEEIEKRLQMKGICCDFINVSDGISRINVKLRSDEETEVNGQGPRISDDDIHKLYEKLNVLKANDILVLAGSIPKGMLSTIYMDIMDYIKEKKVLVIVDATKELLRNVLKYRPFLIKPNNDELGELFDTKISQKEDVVIYAKKLQELGARNVLVSMAKDGAVLVTEDGIVMMAEAPQGKVRNSVGAGDSMVAGFIAGYIEKKDYREAFIMGVCTGSASAFSDELATKEQVEFLRAKNEALFL